MDEINLTTTTTTTTALNTNTNTTNMIHTKNNDFTDIATCGKSIEDDIGLNPNINPPPNNLTSLPPPVPPSHLSSSSQDQQLTQTQQTQLFDFDENSQSYFGEGTPLSPNSNSNSSSKKNQQQHEKKNPLTIPWGRLSSTSTDVNLDLQHANVHLLPRSPLSSLLHQQQPQLETPNQMIKFMGLDLNPSDRFNEYTIGRSVKCDVVATKPSLPTTTTNDDNNINNMIMNDDHTVMKSNVTTKQDNKHNNHQQQLQIMKKTQKFVHDLISNSHCKIFCLLPNTNMNTNINHNHNHNHHHHNVNYNTMNSMEVYIEDTSSNGTYINNNTLLKKNERRILHTGDVICLLNPMIIRKKIKDSVHCEEFIKHYSFVFVNLFQTCGNDIVGMGGGGGTGGSGGGMNLMADYNKFAIPASSCSTFNSANKTNHGHRKRGLVDVRAMNHSRDKTSMFHDITAASPHSHSHPNNIINNNNNQLMPPPPTSSRKRIRATQELNEQQQQEQRQQMHKRVEEEYDIRDEIGSGTCGQVRRAIHRQSGQMVAIKIISLGNAPGSMNRKLSNEEDEMVDKIIQDEASILQSLDHPYIIKLIDVFIHPNKKAVYLVMELVQGGDLFDRIVQKGRYTEIESRRTMRRLLAAIYYLHEDRDVVHRDLKPENILCVSRHDDVHVKLTDFGLAKSITEDGLKTFCGTPQYFAPEVLCRRHTVAGRGRYDKKADMWSLGVILYILLCGAPPFGASTSVDDIQETHIRMEGWKWNSISDSAKKLVRALLKTDPAKRIGVVEACQHEWILMEDGDTHVHPLKDPNLANISSTRAKESTSMPNELTTIQMPGQSTSPTNEALAPQSILSPSPNHNKLQEILNGGVSVSPKMRESKNDDLESNYELMTPSQAANFPLHEEDSKAVTNSKPVERESLFSLVKQHSKEGTNIDIGVIDNKKDNKPLVGSGENEFNEPNEFIKRNSSDKSMVTKLFDKE